MILLLVMAQARMLSRLPEKASDCERRAMTIDSSKAQESKGRIRYGMVGGGQGAFIGVVHRFAARMDDQFEFVAGALSSEPAKAKASAEELGLARDRSYGSFKEMIEKEAQRKDRIDAVVIVTPNHMHFSPAEMALKAGFHVICDKPMTFDLKEAEALVKIAKESGKVFALTHNYTGYPMIRQARAMVEQGMLGDIRVVQAEYAQGWLATDLEKSGQKQAAWRTDPKQSGAGGVIGDVGTHALNLACFVTKLMPEAVLAELHTFVKGRKLDDNNHILLRFKGGAKGMIWASQVAVGFENGLKLRVFGSEGGLEWAQEDPNHLTFHALGQPATRFTRGGLGAFPEAARVTRVPSGHPEGYLEGFANIYQEAARAIRAVDAGLPIPTEVLFPTAEDGLLGMKFVNAAVTSSNGGNKWVKI
jgi:predicted dehydrogenase